MVPFRDQRMSRMSGIARPAPEHHAEHDAHNGHSVDFGKIVPHDAHDAASEAAHGLYNGSATSHASDGDTAAASASALGALAMGLAESGLNGATHAAPAPRAHETPDLPPAIPQAAAASPAEANPAVKDAAAELLRPMLRQWLADNMPRIVEQALHIEVAESLKPPKK